jgi:hypothetical protein
LLVLAALSACRGSGDTSESDLGARARPRAAAPTPSFGSTVPPLPTPAATGSTAASARPTAAPSGSAVTDEPSDEIHGPSASSKLVLDEPIELAPAGPAAADSRGVVMIKKTDEIVLSPRRGAPSHDAHRKLADFALVRAPASDFFPVGKSPLILRGKAYWVSGNRLMRRALDSDAPLEVLSDDARPGTRVAGVDLENAPACAVYVSGPKLDDTPRARLWVEGGATLSLSPEGSAANSVAAAEGGGDLMTLSIDARSGMTPLHGRRVHFTAGKAELGADVVMWVGSSAQTLTEVFAASTPQGALALLPIERDVNHFGLALLAVGAEPHMDPKLDWRTYPNGIDLAPVASAAFCGGVFVAYARPVNAEPGATELLEIAEIGKDGLGAGNVVGRASGFANVSLAKAENGAVLAYVADRLTFATTLRCKR